METTQILLIIVVVVLTILLAVIGVQVVFILNEVRKMAEKANLMMDDASKVTGGISRSLTGMSGLLEGIKTGLTFVGLFGKKHEPKT